MNDNSERVCDCLNSAPTQDALNELNDEIQKRIDGMLCGSAMDNGGSPSPEALITAEYIGYSDAAMLNASKEAGADENLCKALRMITLNTPPEDVIRHLPEYKDVITSCIKAGSLENVSETDHPLSGTFTGALYGPAK